MSIAICGGKFSGKTRAAEVMKKNGYTRASFAHRLKSMLANALPRFEEYMYNPELKEEAVSFAHDFSFDTSPRDKLFKEVLLNLGLTEWAVEQRMSEPSVYKLNLPHLNCTAEELYKTISEYVYKWDNEGATARTVMQEFGTEILRKYNEDIHIMWFEETYGELSNIVCDDARFPNELAYLKERGVETVWLFRPTLGEQRDFHASETSIGQSDCDIMIKSEEGELLDQTFNYKLQKGEFPREVIMS